MERKIFSPVIFLGIFFPLFAGITILSGCQNSRTGDARLSPELGFPPTPSRVQNTGVIPFHSGATIGSSPPSTRSITPAIAPTPTPTASPPMAVLLQNTNCRIGPGADYRNLATLLQGAAVPIIGQDPYRAWWLVRVPAGAIQCWIAMTAADAVGNTSAVPVVKPPPLGCLVKGNDRIDVCFVPCPANVKTEGVCSP